jgi:predicted DNA-binding transcriptional regulator AlpA
MNDNATRLFGSMKEIAALAGVSKSTVQRDVRRGRCPPPIHIGSRALWSLHAARFWIAARRSRFIGKPRKTTPHFIWSEQALPKFVTEEGLSQLLGSSARTTRILIVSGDFPKPVEKPRSPMMWRTIEVAAWLRALERTVQCIG